MAKVELKKMVEKMDLKNLTPDVECIDRWIKVSDINRPALQLAGFFEHFASERVQVIGNVEYVYLQKMAEDERQRIYRELMSYKVPCIVFCRSLQPEPMFLEIASEMEVPVFISEKATTAFISELTRWLNSQLAPCISIHGVLVDVYGVGVLIIGESGIGKSEAALELVKRGHRLVSDDVVEIRRISEDTLIGKAPDITKHFIELRGIGIVDIKTLFGVLSVRETQKIELVIALEEWVKGKEYDRLGLEEEYMELLGNKVAKHCLPIRPGRNLAVIVETASINYRQKQMGYNAAQELYKRVQENLIRR